MENMDSSLVHNNSPSPARLQDTAFEVFVKRAMRNIMENSTGRSQDARKIREACQNFMESVNKGDAGGPKFAPPLSGVARDQVIAPLRLACISDNPKVIEPALSCLHKLVGHCYLQGESTGLGKLDEPNLVSKVTALVAKCGEKSVIGIQLATLRALLTLTTAEHFILHGECLLQAVRTVFNLCIGSDEPDIQRTAKNSLLQMLNTIVKRVACHLAIHDSALSSGAQTPVYSDAGDGTQAVRTPLSVSVPVSNGNSPACTSPQDAEIHNTGLSVQPLVLEAVDISDAGMAEISAIQECHESTQDLSLRQVQGAIEMLTPAKEHSGGETGGNAHHVGSCLNSAEQVQPNSEEQTADESQDLNMSSISRDGDGNDSQSKAAHLLMLAEQEDIEGLEALMIGDPARTPATSMHSDAMFRIPMAGSEQNMKEGSAAFDRKAAWKNLSVQERDVVTVLGALCKLAAREGDAQDAKELYLLQGKLLALEMLVGCVSSTVHQWDAVRPEFVAQLRQPICVTLLRNSMSHDIDCVRYVTRLFSGLLLQPPLRYVMKAELGAFYPLLILRPMEAVPYNPPQLAAALHVLQELCKESSLQVEMFVNFDCELEESNLFERTTWNLKELSEVGDPSAPPTQNHLVKTAALSCVLSLIKSLDTWSGPMRDKMAASAAAGGVTGVSNDMDNNCFGSHLRGVSHDASFDSSMTESSEAERFGSAKQLKTTVEAGVALFNQKPMKGIASLISAGIVEDTPESIVRFLRKNRKDLDKTQVGEYLGHHEDQQIAVMHAYVDSEQFSGMRIDDALRSLLSYFRLPGEAQKIDRIMEKFAERYCKDNPGIFRTADGAYMLAFSIIMLNTDAHNPMVDDKMSVEDFILMNAAAGAGLCHAESKHEGEDSEVQNEKDDTTIEGDGQYYDDMTTNLPDTDMEGLVLPVEELRGIYERIQANEIKMREDTGATSSQISNRRLAAAIGVGGLKLPFRAARRDAARREHATAVLEETRRMLNMGMNRDSTWHHATQSELAIPMLEVSGDNLTEALAFSLRCVSTEEECTPIIEGFNTLIRLCALLGMDIKCAKLAEALVKSTGICDLPQTLASASDTRSISQVAALQALVTLAGAPDSGVLGSAWSHILRCLSALDMMVHNSHYSTTRVVDEPRKGHAGSGSSMSNSSSARSASAFRNMFGRILFGGSKSITANNKSSGSEVRGTDTSRPVEWQLRKDSASAASPRLPGLSASSPGARLVAWAEGEGSADIERIFAGSAKMDGESVVVFFRAMCAVSQEELEDSGRVYMLQKLVECAHHNLGRIRLVWARLWAALTPHIVNATCHSDLKVAMYAVDSLRQLVSKLLARAELAHFTHQEEALRPFCFILRSCDSPVVRELTVQCIAQAITAHPRGLGSGWRAVLQSLEVAASDFATPVVEQALEALQPVVESLYRGTGLRHEYFTDCLKAAMAVVLNKHHPELSLDGLQVMRRCGARIAEARKEEDRHCAVELDDGQTCGLAPPMSCSQTSSHPDCVMDFTDEENPCEAWLRRHEMWDKEESEWAQLTGALVDIAMRDGRRNTAAAAFNAMFDILSTHGPLISTTSWERIQACALGRLFELPPASLRPCEYIPEQGVAYLKPWAVPAYDRVMTHAPVLMPRLLKLLAEQWDGAGRALLHVVCGWVIQFVTSPWDEMASMGASMLEFVCTTMAPVLDEEGWGIVVRALSIAAGADMLQPVAGLPSIYSAHILKLPGNKFAHVKEGDSNHLGIEGTGTSDFLEAIALPPEALKVPSRYIVDICQAVHVRCKTSILVQRAIEQVHRSHSTSLPAELHLRLLDVLLDTVNRAVALNTQSERRAAAERMLHPIHVVTETNNAKILLSSMQALSGTHSSEEQTSQPDVSTLNGALSACSFTEDPVLPAMMRQEAEGGVLALQSLQRTLSSGDPEVVSGAEERLVSLASRIIAAAGETAAALSDRSLDALPGPTMAPGPSRVSSLVAGKKMGNYMTDKNDLVTGTCHSGDEDLRSCVLWDDGIRAPLVVAAITAVAEVKAVSLRADFKTIFPCLTQLMCSSQPSVRKAISDLMQAQLPQMLPTTSPPSAN